MTCGGGSAGCYSSRYLKGPVGLGAAGLWGGFPRPWASGPGASRLGLAAPGTTRAPYPQTVHVKAKETDSVRRGRGGQATGGPAGPVLRADQLPEARRTRRQDPEWKVPGRLPLASLIAQPHSTCTPRTSSHGAGQPLWPRHAPGRGPAAERTPSSLLQAGGSLPPPLNLS